MAGKANIEAGRAVVRGMWDDSLLGRGLRRTEVTVRKFVRSFGSAGRAIDRQWKPVSRAIKDIRHEANKATTALGAMARAGAKATAKGAGAIARGAGKTGTAVGGAMGSAGKYLLGGGMLAGAAGISKVMSSIADTAQIAKTAKAFGMSAEAASGLFGVFKANGAENARESIESLVTLQGRVNDVLTGSGEESKKLFDGLSVSAQQLSGMKPDEQFFALHEAIMKIPSETERMNKLMLAFGEDGGKTLIGTLSKSTQELRNQAKQFQVSEEGMAQATAAQEAMARANAAWGRAWQQLAISVAPLIVRIADGFSAMLAKNPNLVKWLMMGAGALVVVGGALAVLGPMIAGTVTVLGALGAGIAFLVSPVGIAAAALTGLAAAGGYALYQSGALGKALDWLGEKFGPLAEMAKKAFETIKASLAAGQFGEAVKVLWAAIKVAFATGIEWIKGAWIDLKTFLAGVWLALSSQVESVWTSLSAGVVRTLAGAIAKIAGMLAKAAARLGLSKLAAGLSGVSTAASGAAVANSPEATQKKLDAIDEKRRAVEDTLAEDAAKQKAGLGAGTAAAKAEFDAAVKEAAAAAATKQPEAAAAAGGGGGGAAPAAKAKADNAVNRSLDIRSAEGMEAIVKAMGGGKGTEAAVKQQTKITQKMAQDIAEMRKKGMTVAIGKTK